MQEIEQAAMGVRSAAPGINVIDIDGDVTGASEPVLNQAFNDASSPGVKAVVLDFEGLDYMNSGGIGLLVTMLIRAQRNHQQLAAFGLSEHYRQIFSLTRLDEAITIYDDEAAALSEM